MRARRIHLIQAGLRHSGGSQLAFSAIVSSRRLPWVGVAQKIRCLLKSQSPIDSDRSCWSGLRLWNEIDCNRIIVVTPAKLFFYNFFWLYLHDFSSLSLCRVCLDIWLCLVWVAVWKKFSLFFFLSHSARRQFEENPDYRTEIFPEYFSAACASYARICGIDLDALLHGARRNFKIPMAATGCAIDVVYLVILLRDLANESKHSFCYRKTAIPPVICQLFSILFADLDYFKRPSIITQNAIIKYDY